MIKVENYNQNFTNAALKNRRVNSSNPNFTGGIPKTLLSNAETIMSELPQRNAIKFMEKLKYFKGELGGILFTAMGTGLVAPIFIAFNPFVKAPKNATPQEKDEVKKTKLYTAMRQPISAILAAFFQAGVLTYIDRGLDAMTNNPNLSKYWDVIYDQSSLKGDGYLKRQAKKTIKRSDYKTKKEYKDAINAKVNAVKKEQIENVAKQIEETGKIVINGREVPLEVMADVVNKQMEEYIEGARRLKIETDPNKTLSHKSGIEFYKERASLLIRNEDKLRELFAEDKIPNDVESLNKYLHTILQNAKKDQDKDIELIIQEIIDKKNETIQKSRIQRTLARIDKVKEACGGVFDAEKYEEYLKKGNDIIDEKIKELQSLGLGERVEKVKKGKTKVNWDYSKIELTTEKIVEKISALIDACKYDGQNGRLNQLLGSSGIFSSNAEDLRSAICKDLVKGYKKYVQDFYQGFAQVNKIVISVFITLPITCTVLNWVYPRIMDLLFPSLGKSETDNSKEIKGGNK